MAQKQESYFWTSYSDLMTSLFFVMLVLFVLTVVMLKQQNDLIAKNAEEQEKIANSTQEQLDKIKEIEAAIKNIDSTYFTYNEQHKKHILNVEVQFGDRESDIRGLPVARQQQLIEAGNAISHFMQDVEKSHNAHYLLIIEGQTSEDNYPFNDELSYQRALSLKEFWEYNDISFGERCEVVVSGSGEGGTMRDPVNKKNQRFLIHIIPKPGILTN